MAKSANTKGMHGGKDRKNRGRTSITGGGRPAFPHGPSHDAPSPRALKTEANRPVEAGGTKHRGDRRDTSPTYTNNARHRSRGSDPRPDVTTRKR